MQISPYYKQNIYPYRNVFVPSYTQQNNPEYFSTRGDDLMQKKRYDYAIKSYQKSIELSPNNKNLLLKLARAYKSNKEYENTIKNLQTYIASSPANSEAKVLMGETYIEENDYQKALECFENAMKTDPNDDNARRNFLNTQNKILAQTKPALAKKQKYKQGMATLKEALKEAHNYLPQEYIGELWDINICFDKTSSMSGVPNIAQYENSKKRIVITEDYIFASPKLVCAYLIHEFVHAKDRDAHTSVREEQDAYRAATEYWIKCSGDLKDSEMDFAAELYKKSPEALDKRVEEIYTSRDSEIALTSPHHPESNQTNVASSNLSGPNSSTRLKKYDFIA